jgi:hypothetical protein
MSYPHPRVDRDRLGAAAIRQAGGQASLTLASHVIARSTVDQLSRERGHAGRSSTSASPGRGALVAEVTGPVQLA